MKTIITLMLVLVTGATALANNTPANVKVESLKMDIVLVDSTLIAGPYNEITPVKENDVARLYKFKYTRVKKALRFTTKRNKSKLA